MQAPLAQLTWYQHLALLEKLDEPAPRIWYAQHLEQMALAQDDDVIETLTTDAAEETLTDGIHIWRAHGGLDDPRSEGLGSAVEVGSELAVSVANDEARSLA